jgi:hypothetical protein
MRRYSGGTAPDSRPTTIDKLPDELLTFVLGLVDTRLLVTVVPKVCKRWNRACREVRGVHFDLRFLKRPRVLGSGAMLTILAKQWRWVDGVCMDAWQLTCGDFAVLADVWPKLTTIRCGDDSAVFHPLFFLALRKQVYRWLLHAASNSPSDHPVSTLQPEGVLCWSQRRRGNRPSAQG